MAVVSSDAVEGSSVLVNVVTVDVALLSIVLLELVVVVLASSGVVIDDCVELSI